MIADDVVYLAGVLLGPFVNSLFDAVLLLAVFAGIYMAWQKHKKEVMRDK